MRWDQSVPLTAARRLVTLAPVQKHLRRPSEQTFGARVGYRIDRFLALHPLVQLSAVLAAAVVLAFFFGSAIAIIDRVDAPDAACKAQANCATEGVASGLWWAITRMLDGGTVGTDTGSGVLRQAFALGVTLVGLVAVTVLTGAFASSFSERLAAIRRGTLPVFERGHVLLLGWNAHAGVIVRELARSGQRASLVIVADHEREVLEERLRELLDGREHRLSIVVRRGDPTTAAAIRRASARRATAVVILPDTESVHCADRAALRSLLALERVIGDMRHRPHVIVEVASRNGHAMVDLCELPAREGGARPSAVVVQAYEVNALVVAQAVRYRGTFGVIRQILDLDETGIRVHDAGSLAGWSFDDAHFAIDHGALIGVVRGGEARVSPDGELIIDAADQLLVLSDRDVAPAVNGGPPAHGVRRAPIEDPDEPIRVLVMRYRSELVPILDFMDEHGPVRATLLAPAPEIARAREAIERARLEGTTVEFIEGDPLDGATIEAALAQPVDVALLLAPDVRADRAPEADADQLITLLQMRRPRSAPAAPEHAVIEVRSPETRLPKQLGHGDDFILSREIVGLLLARQLHALAFGGHSTYHAVLDAFTPTLELRPMERYAGGLAEPTFGDLMAGARRCGEVAIGVAIGKDAAKLLPRRGEAFPAAGSRLVVLHPRPRAGADRPPPPPSSER